MSMIERVARAMFPLVPNCRGRSFEDHPMRDDLMKKARAAIEAMRELGVDYILLGGEVEHASDCAVHNEPAFPAGPCDCGAALKGEAE